MTNPMQPIWLDKSGVARFKENQVVRYFLNEGGLTLNDLAREGDRFTQDDKEQFMQLIGYSVSGFGDLDFVSDETYDKAEAQVIDMELDQPTPTSSGDSKPPKHSCTAEIIAELERLKEIHREVVYWGDGSPSDLDNYLSDRQAELKAKETQL